MLGKLFIHEWKDSWKLMTILTGAVVVLSIAGIALNAFSDSIDLSRKFESGGTLYVMLYGSYFMLYVLSIFALSIGSAIYFYIRFYKNLYTDQGYLMHTLPVSEHSLIWSKALIAILWRLAGMVIMTLGIGSLVLSFLVPIFRNEYLSLKDILRELGLIDLSPFYLIAYAILGLLFAIGSVIFSVFMGYAAISIGQLAGKNKVIASVGAYFGIQIILSIASNIITQSVMFAALKLDFRWDIIDNYGPLSIIYLCGINVGVYALSIVFYFITYTIMKKRLNLE